MDIFGTSAEIEAAGAQWTAREILQQPALWAEIETRMAARAAELWEFLEPLLANPRLRIVLTGAGTSAHIGECLAPALACNGLRVDAIATTDLVASPLSYLSAGTPTLLISFGRSGNSPESVAAVEIADSCVESCSHLVFTCDASGALYKRAQNSAGSYAILLPERSNDRSFAMTSSFTGMLLAAGLALRATPANKDRAHALGALAHQVVPGTLSLLKMLTAAEFERVVYLGSREFKGLARESALKMLELTDGKVVSVAESSLGFRHGPKTIVNDSTLVVVYVSNDEYTRKYDLDIVHELRRDAVAGRVIALHGRASQSRHPDDIVLHEPPGPAVASDLELCLPYVVFAQSFALLRSLSVGVRPDSPNAAGTVNRVVEGVTIHPWRDGE